jgi:hypothetical protein
MQARTTCVATLRRRWRRPSCREKATVEIQACGWEDGGDSAIGRVSTRLRLTGMNQNVRYGHVLATARSHHNSQPLTTYNIHQGTHRVQHFLGFSFSWSWDVALQTVNRFAACEDKCDAGGVVGGIPMYIGMPCRLTGTDGGKLEVDSAGGRTGGRTGGKAARDDSSVCTAVQCTVAGDTAVTAQKTPCLQGKSAHNATRTCTGADGNRIQLQFFNPLSNKGL